MSVIFEAMGLTTLLYRASTHLPLHLRKSESPSSSHSDKDSWLSSRLCPTKSSAKSPNLRLHMICGSTSGRHIDVIQPFRMFLPFDHLCALNNKSVRQRYRRRILYQPLRPNGIRLPIFRNPPLPHPPWIVKLK
jgi:hypothetical protein